MSRLLVFDDDDRPLVRSVAIILRAHGYEVTVAHDGGSALGEATRVRRRWSS
ncbi:MAG: hypothetical protein ABJD68_17175 [Nakamurella sp.]